MKTNILPSTTLDMLGTSGELCARKLRVKMPQRSWNPNKVEYWMNIAKLRLPQATTVPWLLRAARMLLHPTINAERIAYKGDNH